GLQIGRLDLHAGLHHRDLLPDDHAVIDVSQFHADQVEHADPRPGQQALDPEPDETEEDDHQHEAEQGDDQAADQHFRPRPERRVALTYAPDPGENVRQHGATPFV